MVEEIINNEQLFAIIVSNSFHKSGITFFTSNDLSQQLAYMSHPKGKMIEPHIHKEVTREVKYTQEVLIIKSGVLKVNFYTDDKAYLTSRILSDGDVILLATGGHGFEVIEDVIMFEVKQGPYISELDKIKFKPNE